MADSCEHGSEILVYRGKCLLTRRTAISTLRCRAGWCVDPQKSLCFMRTGHALSGNYIDTCLFVHYRYCIHGKVQSPLSSVKYLFNEAFAFWKGHGSSLFGISLPTFRDTLSVSSSRLKQANKQFKKSWIDLPLKIGPIGCPAASVTNYQSTLRNVPKERRPHLHFAGSLISCIAIIIFRNLLHSRLQKAERRKCAKLQA